MSYVEEYRALVRQVTNYTAGERTARRTANTPFRDTTDEKWERAERRINKLREYFERHGIDYVA